MKRDRNGQQSDRGAERARWVGQYRASGLGLKRFAARHGLSTGRLHYWVYGASKVREAKALVPVFREVRLTGSMEPPSGWAAEIALANGATVRLREGAAADWAASLVQALGGPCSR